MSDLGVLAKLVVGMPRRGSHAERLEGFYAGQAEDYDRFRVGLLHGRDELIQRLPLEAGKRLVELGGGTGRNLEAIGERRAALEQVWLVDLCPALLAVARRRKDGPGWANVEMIAADACTWQPPQPVDVVMCSYSLTMIPDWQAAIANAKAMLKPGGTFACVDFTCLRASPDERLQSGIERWFWRRWFGHDGVRPSHLHLAHLRQTFRERHAEVRRVRLPYLPIRAAYYLFVGEKA